MALPEFEKDMRIVSVLSDRPNAASNEHLDGLQLKQKFDEGGEALKEYINETLIPFLAGSEAAASLGIGTISGISEATNIQQALEALKFAIDNTTAGAIPNGSLSGAKLSPAAITERELAANSVTAGKIADNAVSGTKVADKGINGEKIADGSIKNQHLGELVVENGNIADGTIDASGKLRDGSVTAKLLAAGSVAEAAIAGGAVTRAKLAQDALYSPITSASTTTILSNDMIGKTLRMVNGNGDFVINVNKNAAIPVGAEIAIMNNYSKSNKIVFGSGVKACWAGCGSTYVASPTLTIPEMFTMIALKKISSDSSTDYWLVTGNAEVVA